MRRWSGEQVGQLAKLRGQGKTFSQIAEIMHISRSQVAGKVMRERMGGNKVNDHDRARLQMLTYLRARVERIEEVLTSAKQALQALEG